MVESGATPVENVRRRSGPLKVVGVRGWTFGSVPTRRGDRPASRLNGRNSRAVESGIGWARWRLGHHGVTHRSHLRNCWVAYLGRAGGRFFE